MPALIRTLVHLLSGVVVLSAFLVIGDATVSSATGTTPTVTNVSPNSGPTTGGTAITVTGTGFVTGARVVIGQGHGARTDATPATNVVVVSSTEITAVTGGDSYPGTFSLFAITSGGTSAGNLTDHFTYFVPQPTVTGVSPNSGPTTGGTAITVTGTGFIGGYDGYASVVIGQGEGSGNTAIPATNVKIVSSTEITATTGGGAKAGTWSLYVIASGGSSAPNIQDDFTYTG